MLKLKRYNLFFSIVAGGVILLFSGCGQQLPDGMPTLYPCKITLTQEGKPAVNASVILHPIVQGDKYWAISSFSDTNGVAVMSTNGKYKGVPAGTYKITVEKLQEEHLGAKGYYMVDFIDPQYRTPDKTPLEIEVAESRSKNVFSFELGKEEQTRITPLMPNPPMNPIEMEKMRKK
jgi:hypothetical protein